MKQFPSLITYSCGLGGTDTTSPRTVYIVAPQLKTYSGRNYYDIYFPKEYYSLQKERPVFDVNIEMSDKLER